MRRLLLLLLAGLPPAAAPAQAPASAPAPIVIGQSFELKSAIMGEAREINVWTPPSYATGKKSYPVLYVVDGGLDQDFHHISGLAQLATINGNFEELIVVGIRTGTRNTELTARPADPRFVRAWPAAGGADRFRRHVAEEVLPFVRQRYRTGGRRALIGESLAGLFVLETFLKTPSLFTDYIVVSPSLWWDARALARQAPALLAAHDAAPRRLYLTAADEGGTMQAGIDAVVAALKAAPPAGLEYSYVDRRATDTHATIYHGGALDALRTLFGLPPYEFTPAQTWFMREDGQPPPSD